MSDRAHLIVTAHRNVMAKSGITMSENDVINFLIGLAAFSTPLTVADARNAIERHWDTCSAGCSPTPPPKCAMGAHLVRCYSRAAAAEQERYAGPTPAPPPAAATAPRQSSPTTAAFAEVWTPGET